jgi:hypothetical protein
VPYKVDYQKHDPGPPQRIESVSETIDADDCVMSMDENTATFKKDGKAVAVRTMITSVDWVDP